MCGRTRCALQPSRLKKQLGITKWVDEREFKPSYNIGPGFWLPTICSTTHGTELRSMKWGLVPSFTKPASEPDFFKMFNCRSDTMHEKPSFRRLVGRNQCLVVVEGFYEWRREHKGKHGKQPYFIHLKSDADDNQIQLMMLAGLYDTWKDSNGQISLTCTILTTEADDQLSWLHDRMPVILATKEDQNKWLNMSPEFRASLATSGSKAYSKGNGLSWYPVTPKMGKIQFQGEECSKEIKRRSILSMLSPPKKKQSGKDDTVSSTHANITVDDKGDPDTIQLKRELESGDVNSQACHGHGNLDEAPQVKEEDAVLQLVAKKRQKIH